MNNMTPEAKAFRGALVDLTHLLHALGMRCSEESAQGAINSISCTEKAQGRALVDWVRSDLLIKPPELEEMLQKCEALADAWGASADGPSPGDTVRGWRYGAMPASGHSWNYRENQAEAGVSMAWIEGEAEVQSFAVLGASDREKCWYRGILLEERGGDDEPLLTNCSAIGPPNQT